jgi:hypothetical protein
MPPAGFEPAIPVGDRPQTLALDTIQTHDGIFSNLPPSGDTVHVTYYAKSEVALTEATDLSSLLGQFT